MWLALVLVVGNALTFSFDNQETCDDFMSINAEYFAVSHQVPSAIMCMQVWEI